MGMNIVKFSPPRIKPFFNYQDLAVLFPIRQVTTLGMFYKDNEIEGFLFLKIKLQNLVN